MGSTKSSMDRAMSILVTPITLLDTLEKDCRRQRTIWVSLTAVMMVAINKMIGQSADHGLIPEVVIVAAQLPVNPLRAHLVETRDLIHGSDGESSKEHNGHTGNNDDGDSFCRKASLSSQGKQDPDTQFS